MSAPRIHAARATTATEADALALLAAWARTTDRTTYPAGDPDATAQRSEVPTIPQQSPTQQGAATGQEGQGEAGSNVTGPAPTPGGGVDQGADLIHPHPSAGTAGPEGYIATTKPTREDLKHDAETRPEAR